MVGQARVGGGALAGFEGHDLCCEYAPGASWSHEVQHRQGQPQRASDASRCACRGLGWLPGLVV